MLGNEYMVGCLRTSYPVSTSLKLRWSAAQDVSASRAIAWLENQNGAGDDPVLYNETVQAGSQTAAGISSSYDQHKGAQTVQTSDSQNISKLFWPEREQASISKRHCRSRLAWTLYLSWMVLRKYTEMFFAISDALLREAYTILQEAMYPKYGDRGWTQMQVYSMAYPEYNHWSFCGWTSLFYCGFVHCLLALCCVSLSQINPWLESCLNQECAFTNQA